MTDNPYIVSEYQRGFDDGFKRAVDGMRDPPPPVTTISRADLIDLLTDFCTPDPLANMNSEEDAWYAFEILDNHAKDILAFLAERRTFTEDVHDTCTDEREDPCHKDFIAPLAALSAPSQSPAAPATERKPDGYAYRYPHFAGGTYIDFSNGEERNGSMPIEAVPYYFGTPPVTQSPAVQVDGWQPIETAPKDGTDVMLFPHFIVTHWEQSISSFAELEVRGDDCQLVPQRIEFTHWMPLPKRPMVNPTKISNKEIPK